MQSSGVCDVLHQETPHPMPRRHVNSPMIGLGVLRDAADSDKIRDSLISAERSRLMSRVRQKGTAPELVVRRLLREMGVPYRLNVKSLPGSPDIVLTGRKKAIVVHGCFWHRHPGCKAASTPKTRIEFWTDKFASNIARDRKLRRALNALGYSVMVVWECQAKKSPEREKMIRRLDRFATKKTIGAHDTSTNT
jgi:DNA mismatch endonuclease, patch repair protein